DAHQASRIRAPQCVSDHRRRARCPGRGDGGSNWNGGRQCGIMEAQFIKVARVLLAPTRPLTMKGLSFRWLPLILPQYQMDTSAVLRVIIAFTLTALYCLLQMNTSTII